MKIFNQQNARLSHRIWPRRRRSRSACMPRILKRLDLASLVTPFGDLNRKLSSCCELNGGDEVDRLIRNCSRRTFQIVGVAKNRSSQARFALHTGGDPATRQLHQLSRYLLIGSHSSLLLGSARPDATQSYGDKEFDCSCRNFTSRRVILEGKAFSIIAGPEHRKEAGLPG